MDQALRGNKGLRSKGEIVRQLERYVYLRWARKPFFEIRRKTVNELLDKIEEHALRKPTGCWRPSALSATGNRPRDENYVSPIVKGMRRDHRPAGDRARSRILTDDEIATVWKAAETAGPFGSIVRLLLLTGQRREKVARMKWSHVQGGVWSIATEPREKGNAGALRLPPIAVEIIAARTRLSAILTSLAASADGGVRQLIDRVRPPSIAGRNARPSWTRSCPPTCPDGRFTTCGARRGR